MGKVLIALCTVFLLAFPARGEQAVTWESLTVWNDLPPLYDPAPWPSDLAGKRVILRWNGKHNGDLLLDYLHSLLSRAFPDTEFITGSHGVTGGVYKARERSLLVWSYTDSSK